jgi:hypothetical protein
LRKRSDTDSRPEGKASSEGLGSSAWEFEFPDWPSRKPLALRDTVT